MECILRSERRPAGDEFVSHHAQGVNIACWRTLTLKLFRRHVRQRSGNLCGVTRTGGPRVADTRDSEIDQLHLLLAVSQALEHNVLRFDIAVADAFPMGSAERTAGLPNDSAGLLQVHPTCGVDQLTQ